MAVLLPFVKIIPCALKSNSVGVISTMQFQQSLMLTFFKSVLAALEPYLSKVKKMDDSSFMWFLSYLLFSYIVAFPFRPVFYEVHRVCMCTVSHAGHSYIKVMCANIVTSVLLRKKIFLFADILCTLFILNVGVSTLIMATKQMC